MNFRIDVYANQKQYPFVEHAQEYAHKAGLVKTEDEVVGVVIKGVGKSFDQKAFSENIVEGRFIDFPDSAYAHEIVLSRTVANVLKAGLNDEIIVHFFQNPPRFRKLKVVGIYETNLSEYFDSRIVIGDLRLIQRLNDWDENTAGGIEVFLSSSEKVDEAGEAIAERMDYDLIIERVSDRYMQVFQWLDLLSRQVNILLVIILTVVCVNMISIVLILVMERTQMIGMLKALGAKDGLIRSVFFYNGVNLVFKGLVLGNFLGLGLCWIQDRFKIVTLNPRDYYMSFVPISWHWDIVLYLNLLTLVLVSTVLLLPTFVIARVNPIKAIRFD